MNMPATTLNNDFRENLGKKDDGFYHVRLGKKVYMVNISLDYTPEFESYKGHTRAKRPFYWSSDVLVKDNDEAIPRKLNERELGLNWIKTNLKAVVNYQRSIDRDYAFKNKLLHMHDNDVASSSHRKNTHSKNHWRIEQNA